MVASRHGLLLASAMLAWAACGGGATGGEAPTDGKRAAAAQPAAAPAAACALEVAAATVWLLGREAGEGAAVKTVQVSPASFARRPEVGSEAWVVPYPAGEAVRLAVVGVEQDADGPRWLARLEEASHTALRLLQAPPGRRPEAPSDAAVVWPAADGPPRVVSPAATGLPAEVAASTLAAALDIDQDARADLLLVEFCCDDRSSRTDCEYLCGETWQRSGERWRRCSSWQPG